MTRRLGLLLLGALSLLPVGARGEDVVVFAAASLTDVLQELGRRFEATTGHKVVFNFGGSGDLARQLRAGAAADLFFSADSARMDELEQAGLVRREDRVDALSNALVVIVPTGSALAVHDPADLAALGRIALADPETVPAGVYARRWLESLGLWQRVEPRVVPTLDVRAALAAVGSEHVDAGVVYRTDAALSPRVRVAFEAAAGPKITYVLAPLARSRSGAAAALLRELVSDAAARVYERYGFIVLGRS